MNANLEAIKKRDQEWYKRIETYQIDENQKNVDIIESDKSLDENKILYIEKDGIDYRLNSLYSPIHEAKRWVEGIEFKNLQHVMTMYGLGNGYFVRELMNKMSEKDVLVVYEPCIEIFLHVLEEYDIQDILNNQRVIIYVEGTHLEAFHVILKSLIVVSEIISNIIVLHPHYQRIFLKGFKKFITEVQTTVSHARIDFNTYMVFAKNLAKNTFINLEFLDDIVLFDEFKENVKFDKPVIIVAAGPSIEENIDELRSLKGKAIIIAVDRILDYLLDHDIVPDYVATLDPCKGADKFTTRDFVEIPMLTILFANNVIWKKQKGKKIICNVGTFLYQWLRKVRENVSMMETGASVACFAFEVAMDMGCKDIILVGQDLAFKGNITHAGGVISNPYTAETIMVDGLNGEPIASRYDWIEFRNWFQDKICANEDVNVYDTKNSGAKIEGSIVLPLNEAFAVAESELEKELIDEQTESVDINDLKPAFEGDMKIQLIDFVKECYEDLGKIKKKSREGISLSSELIQLTKEGKINSKKVSDKIDRMGKLHDVISKYYIYQLLDGIVTEQMLNSHVESYQNSDDLEKDSLNVFESERVMFEKMIEAVKYIEPIIKDTMDKFKV